MVEPITTITYILITFFGYYVGADIYNYIYLKNEFSQIKSELYTMRIRLNDLNIINNRLNEIDRINTSLKNS